MKFKYKKFKRIVSPLSQQRTKLRKNFKLSKIKYQFINILNEIVQLEYCIMRIWELKLEMI